MRMQCEEFHGSVSARVAEGPVKRIHWIPLRRRVSLCWAARGGEALELSNPLSGELGITSAATCLPTSSQNHRHTQSYIQRIRSKIFTVNPIYAQKRGQSAHCLGISSGATWLGCIQKTTIPNLSKACIGPSLLMLASIKK